MKNFLDAEEIGILEETHHSCRLRKNADRIKAILLLNEGYNFGQIAKILLLDDTTIRRYLIEFREVGIDGLLEDRYQGAKGSSPKWKSAPSRTISPSTPTTPSRQSAPTYGQPSAKTTRLPA